MRDNVQNTRDAILCTFTKKTTVWIQPLYTCNMHWSSPNEIYQQVLMIYKQWEGRGWAMHRERDMSYTVHSTALCVSAIWELTWVPPPISKSLYPATQLTCTASKHLGGTHLTPLPDWTWKGGLERTLRDKERQLIGCSRALFHHDCAVTSPSRWVGVVRMWQAANQGEGNSPMNRERGIIIPYMCADYSFFFFICRDSYLWQ